ncbi:MAG: DUF3606 domain-containing protein [Comamonadaceae bacterium]|nr:MAG: DUF3606 domain-containing protein [Comamonadaceae bacterium]
MQGDLTGDSPDIKPRTPDDVLRVQLDEPWQTDYWCAQFFCTPDQLSAAVATVGVMAADVHNHLKVMRP